MYLVELNLTRTAYVMEISRRMRDLRPIRMRRLANYVGNQQYLFIQWNARRVLGILMV